MYIFHTFFFLYLQLAEADLGWLMGYHVGQVPYSLIFSRIKYFAVWLNSAQKQIFTDKIFVVERELC